MKHFLSTLIVSLAMITAVAQTIELTPDSTLVLGTTADYEIPLHVEVLNNAGDINVIVTKNEVNQVSGSSSYFCFGVNCFPDFTVTSSPQAMVGGGAEDLKAVFKPNQLVGHSVVEYCVYPEGSPSDSACVTLHYEISEAVGIEENAQTFFSEFHPNPTPSEATLEFELTPNQQAEVVVLDMLGSVVSTHYLSGQKGRLVLGGSEMKAGLYFTNIFVDNELYDIKRLIITE
jgi:hypothetical protein